VSVVYWIRLEDHFDMSSDGYIGVAVDFDSRLVRHRSITSRSDCHFGRAIRYHGWKNMLCDVIFSGADTECYALESNLRPDFQIGWNEAIGGCGGDRSEYIDYAARGKPVGNTKPRTGLENPFFGKSHNEETRRTQTIARSQSVIRTPDGIFFGFNSLARHLKVHKATAKNIALKQGWEIESKPALY
jgi:hypothetical protein